MVWVYSSSVTEIKAGLSHGLGGSSTWRAALRAIYSKVNGLVDDVIVQRHCLGFNLGTIMSEDLRRTLLKKDSLHNNKPLQEASPI